MTLIRESHSPRTVKSHQRWVCSVNPMNALETGAGTTTV
jgi:hypothetical protein